MPRVHSKPTAGWLVLTNQTWGLLEMQNFRSHSRPTESGSAVEQDAQAEAPWRSSG